VKTAGLADRITFPAASGFQGFRWSNRPMPQSPNSLLHHVPIPCSFWYRCGNGEAGLPVLVMDLLRPDSPEEAQAIVDRYAAKEAGDFAA